MKEVKHTPEYYLAYDVDLNDFSLAKIITDPESHARKTKEATDGNIICKYVPLSIAMMAPETAAERDKLKEEAEKLKELKALKNSTL